MFGSFVAPWSRAAVVAVWLCAPGCTCSSSTPSTPHPSPTPSRVYRSVFDRVPARTFEVPSPRTTSNPELPADHREVLAVYDALGLPPLDDCRWGSTSCTRPGWICPQGVLPLPAIPVASPVDAAEDLSLLVACDDPHPATDDGGFERSLRKALEVHARPSMSRELNYGPRDSAHLIWMTWAHWAHQRERPDLFALAMAQVETATAGRCPRDDPHGVGHAVAAQAAASLAAAAKRAIEASRWIEAGQLATRALALLEPAVLACKEGARARDSAIAAKRRAELELSELPTTHLGTPAPRELGPWVDARLLDAMRGRTHPAKQRLVQRGDDIVPWLVARLDEPAMIRMPSSGGLERPRTLADFVLDVLGEVTGHAWTNPDEARAWWAAREEKRR